MLTKGTEPFHAFVSHTRQLFCYHPQHSKQYSVLFNPPLTNVLPKAFIFFAPSSNRFCFQASKNFFWTIQITIIQPNLKTRIAHDPSTLYIGLITFKYFLQLIIEFIYIRKEKYFVHSIQLEKAAILFLFLLSTVFIPTSLASDMAVILVLFQT